MKMGFVHPPVDVNRAKVDRNVPNVARLRSRMYLKSWILNLDVKIVITEYPTKVIVKKTLAQLVTHILAIIVVQHCMEN